MVRAESEAGAAAVEFALVLPLLAVLLFGIIDFGRMFWEQVTLTSAAREGVRVLALGETDPTVVRDKTVDAASGISADDITVTVDGSVVTGASQIGTICTVGESVSVIATATFDFWTPLPDLAGFTGLNTITGKGVMRCGG